MNLAGVAERTLRVRALRSARGGAADVHAIALSDSIDLGAYEFDHARGVRSWRVREVRTQRVVAASDVGVDRIHAGRLHADDHLARSGRGIRDVFHDHHRRISECAHYDRLHARTV